MTTLTLCRHLPYQVFKIWAPRYHDKSVLLKDKNISQHNKIIFTNAPSMGELPYYISGGKAKTFKAEMMLTKDGRKIKMRVIPEDELSLLEYSEYCEHLF